MKKCSTPLFSQEGIVQGDPMSMLIYAIATLPLISELKDSMHTQIWYADDSSVAGNLNHIRLWFDKISKISPYFGYFPEPRKSHLVIHDNSTLQAESLFGDLGMSINTSARYLGGVIGDSGGIEVMFLLK